MGILTDSIHRHSYTVTSFNPLHRGMGILTGSGAASQPGSGYGFNPLHRGMGILTLAPWWCWGLVGFCFNPLHRGMGILTLGFLVQTPAVT